MGLIKKNAGVNSGYTAQAVCDKYDAYQAGEISKDSYFTFLIRFTTKLMQFVITTHHFADMGPTNEELLQQCALCVCAEGQKYDPHTCKPSTYFAPRFLQYCKELLPQTMNSMTSRHYQDAINKVRQSLRDKGRDDSDLERYSPYDLYQISGVPVRTITEAMQLAARRVSYMDDDDCKEQYESRVGDGPETSMLKRERTETIHKALEKLSALQRYLVIRHNEDANVSFSTILEEVEAHRDELGIDPDKKLYEAQIHVEYQAGLQALKEGLIALGYFEDKRKKLPDTVTDEDDGTMEDIGSFFEMGGDEDEGDEPEVFE